MHALRRVFAEKRKVNAMEVEWGFLLSPGRIGRMAFFFFRR